MMSNVVVDDLILNLGIAGSEVEMWIDCLVYGTLAASKLVESARSYWIEFCSQAFSWFQIVPFEKVSWLLSLALAVHL